MAKSKSTSSTKSASGSSAKRKSASTDDGSPARAAKKSTATAGARGFSADDIGHAAGEVWGLLTRDGGQTLATIKKSIDAPADIVAAAIGWLAREDKLEFSAKGKQVIISLR